MQGPYKHGVGCTCAYCHPSFEMAKCSGYYADAVSKARVLGKDAEPSSLASAEAMDSGRKEQAHNQKVWGDRYIDQPGQPKITVEERAKHLSAAGSHAQAAHHFGQAARAFDEGRPKAAEEHLQMANKHKKAGDTKSEELGMNFS